MAGKTNITLKNDQKLSEKVVIACQILLTNEKMQQQKFNENCFENHYHWICKALWSLIWVHFGIYYLKNITVNLERKVKKRIHLLFFTRTCRILIPFTIFEFKSFKNNLPGKFLIFGCLSNFELKLYQGLG